MVAVWFRRTCEREALREYWRRGGGQETVACGPRFAAWKIVSSGGAS